MSFLINPYQFGKLINEFDYLTTNQRTGDANHTWTSVDIGAEDADRKIIAAMMHFDINDGYTMDSVTIGGVSAVEIGSYLDSGASDTCNVSYWVADVPTGTTADIQYIASGVTANVVAGSFFRVVGGNDLTNIQDSATSEITGSATLDCNVTSQSIVIGAQIIRDQAASTWVGLTEHVDTHIDLGPNGDCQYTCASHFAISAETPRTISCTTTVPTGVRANYTIVLS